MMAKTPESQPIGNIDPGKRGRHLGGTKHKAQINSEVTLKQVKERKLPGKPGK